MWFGVQEQRCEACGHALTAYKSTERRRLVSVRLGVIHAIEMQRACDECEGAVARSRALQAFAPPGGQYTYDAIAFVGWLYFRKGLNLQAIQTRFKKRTGRRLPRRTASHLVRLFVEYVACVQAAAGPGLREELARAGGYVLHIDGTCEPGSDVLLLAVARVDGRTWVLGAQKFATENEDGVTEFARTIRRDFGVWLAAVRDLARALENGLANAANGVRQFACQSHFVRDVGKKLLEPGRQALVAAFRQWNVTPRLSQARKSARRVLKAQACAESARALKALLESPQHPSDLSTSTLHRGLTCLWSQWLRAYRRDGKGRTFPFAHPELNYVQRCQRAYDELQELGQRRFQEAWVKRSVHKLLEILRPVCEHSDFLDATRRYREALSEFDKLRAALRMPHQHARTCAWTGSVHDRVRQAEAFDQHLSDYRESVDKRLCGRLTAERRRCLEIIAGDLKRHWPYLRGHALMLDHEAGSRVLMVDRTNNLLESLIRDTKRAYRRRNGNKHVGRELQSLPAEAALTLNLRDERYMELVYGGEGWECLARAFPRVYDRVHNHREQEQDMPLCDIRLRPKELANPDLPDLLAAVYEHQLTEA